jgi:hypothetical protein
LWANGAEQSGYHQLSRRSFAMIWSDKLILLTL